MACSLKALSIETFASVGMFRVTSEFVGLINSMVAEEIRLSVLKVE